MTRAIPAAVVLAAALAASPVSPAAAQSEKPVVLNVGDTRGVDSMNVTVGVNVVAYEAWNLQYALLTGKSSKDFSPIPGLAASWKGSADGRTWTYKMRPNQKWSDGRPLTSEDVAYTINRSRKEEWINHTSTTANLTATTPDPETLVVRSSVPDPKLPVIDAYIVPKHVFQKYDDKAITKYDATDGVGSGPFVLERLEKGQFARFKANPNFYGGRPAIDRVVLRKFNNPDAMVAALKRGELDAAFDIPGNQFKQLREDSAIETVEGFQGAMEELAINGGDGLKKPHPALLDVRVRRAIGHAIDKRTLIDRVAAGFARPIETLSVSPDPKWTPEIADGQVFDFDLAKARKILDDAGYGDTDGNGIREMPGGGRALNLRYAVRSEGVAGAPTAELITGWLRQIGIATTRKVYDDSQLTEAIGKGEYDMFAWGWTPFVDPDQMLSYFTCSQVSDDPENPTDYYNDANHCDPRYDALYERQKVELDEDARVELVHQMLTRFQQSGTYHVLYQDPDLQAYRKDRFTGWVRQPEKTGPVIYSNSSPSYAVLEPASASAASGGGDEGGGSAGIIIAVLAAVLVLGGGLVLLRRRRTADERE